MIYFYANWITHNLHLLFYGAILRTFDLLLAQHLGLSSPISLQPNPSKNQSNPGPLPRRKAMIKPHHTQQHGKQLSRHRDRHQNQTPMKTQRQKYKDLAYCSGDRKRQYIQQYPRVKLNERERSLDFGWRGSKQVGY